MTRIEQEIQEILHEAQESFGSAASFAQIMAGYVCPRCHSPMTVGGGRSATANLNFADACLRLAARAGAVNAQFKNEINQREHEVLQLRAELQQMRNSAAMRPPDTTPTRYQTMGSEGQRQLPGLPPSSHKFTDSGICADCGDGRVSMRACPGKQTGEKTDRFSIIEID